MPIYRVVRGLSRGFDYHIPAGELTDLSWLTEDQQERLLTVGAVSRISAPPLRKIPGWSLRAEKLTGLGINGFESFLEADPDWIAERMEVQRRTVDKWRAELENWLRIPAEKREA